MGMVTPKYGGYWVVRVSFRKGNPIHRSIGAYQGEGEWLLFNAGYESPIQISTEQLIADGGSFETVAKIRAMDD